MGDVFTRYSLLQELFNHGEFDDRQRIIIKQMLDELK